MTIQHSDGSDDSALDSAQNDAQPPQSDEESGSEHGRGDVNGPTEGKHEHTPDSSGGGQVSEAGGASLNAETSQGGADAVPDAHG